MRPRLRLFTGDDDSATIAEPQFSVRLGELTRILGEAAQWDRSWIEDFSEDEIQVSSDLYEVLSAYLRMRPGA